MKNFFLLITALVSVSASAALPDGRSADELARWAARHDYMEERFLPRPEAGDHQTPYGTVIDASCLGESGLSEARIRKLERAIGYALLQAARCHEGIGFGELRGAHSIIRRMRISCGEAGGENTLAWTTIVRSHGWKPGRRVFSHFHTSPGYDRDYRFTFEVHDPSLNLLDPKPHGQGASVEKLASTIVHETLHVSGANNRTWHNEVGSMSSTGCSNTRYTDRIYFIQGACFPAVDSYLFYAEKNGSGKCTNVCMSALTERDDFSGWSNWVSRSEGGDLDGPPVLAVPYPGRQAEIVCGRVRRRISARHEADERIHRIFSRYVANDRFTRRNLPEAEAERVFRLHSELVGSALSEFRFVGDSDQVTIKLYSALNESLPRSLRVMRRRSALLGVANAALSGDASSVALDAAHAKLMGEVNRLCRGAGRYRAFCETARARFGPLADMWRGEVQSLGSIEPGFYAPNLIAR